LRRPADALRPAVQAALELLLPARCALCDAPLPAGRRSALCGTCRASLPWLPPDGCALCQDAPATPGRLHCPDCSIRASALLACVAAVSLRGAAEPSIRRFKYPARGLAHLDAGPRTLVLELAREAATRAPGGTPDSIVPVPLHRRKLRSRGFNPAATLARELARQTGARTRTRALLRIRDTPSQTARGREERRRNVAGAFALHPGAPLGRRIWLVDDVVTTGATLEAAARVLKRAGAVEVVAVCAARTLAH